LVHFLELSIGSGIAALHDSAFGTKQTPEGRPAMSAFGGKAESNSQAYRVSLQPNERESKRGRSRKHEIAQQHNSEQPRQSICVRHFFTPSTRVVVD
jgi:hypothetical protein